MNIYVGNLSYDATQEQVEEFFAEYGEVTSVRLISDRETGRPKGFGFVEMSDRSSALNAIDSLNGKEMLGRRLVVNEARPRAARF